MHGSLNRNSRILIMIVSVTFIFLLLGINIQRCSAGEGIGWHGPYPYKPPKAGFNKKYENAKIIKRYDQSNADELKGLIPDVRIEWMKHPEKWGPFYVNEMEYIKYEPSANYIAATKKYAGSYKK